MEGGHGAEFEASKQIEKTEKGFSEKRAARILEGKRMDNAQVKKRKPIVFSAKQKILKRAARVAKRLDQKTRKRAARLELSQREKILEAHEKNAKALIALIKTLGILAKGSERQEEQLMMEIRARQKIQEELLNALVLESRGQLSEDALPKELHDLIK